MQSWEINPQTGDYVLESGSPKETDSLKIPAYMRLKIRRGEWLYAPNEDYGSDFHKLKRNQVQNGPTFIESVGAKALQPIADDGRASEIDLTGKIVARNNADLEVAITDANGNIERIVFERII